MDYRLSGEGCHPAQLLDALAGYAYLVKGCNISPERIVIIADCAGSRWNPRTTTQRGMKPISVAHLTLMLLRYLKDESIFQMPGGIMLFSVGGIFSSLLPGT